ncbi:MAG: hypothetical protein WC951_13190, partial [Bacteroidales bacterium]
KFAIALILNKGNKLRLSRQLGKYIFSCFHTVIIASICCVLLSGCGYKTPPKYAPDVNYAMQSKGK